LDLFIQIIKKIWFIVSATLWIASERIAQDQDKKNQTNLRIATIKFQIIADNTEMNQ